MQTMLLKSIHFENFRVLKDATLPLSPCTLILGPNGSGKSTVFRALELAGSSGQFGPGEVSLGVSSGTTANVGFDIQFENELKSLTLSSGREPLVRKMASRDPIHQKMLEWLRGTRAFSLNPAKIAEPARLQPVAEIGSNGANLSVVLTQLQDKFPERFDALNASLSFWLPEFDRVLFDITADGQRALMLRTKVGGYAIKATDVSDGTLLILCIMTLSYLPEPPTLVCLEEPDRGIHPRLLRQVHDAMIRLSDPKSGGDSKKPVQVIATTHSPYFLDQFRDHPQDVVLAEKGIDGATFHRLTDMEHYQEIMDGASLGDAWYTGILGGVPVRP
jgi:predicted ATPase